MSVPDFQSLMLPVMRAIQDGREWSNTELRDRLAHEFQLTEDELRQKLESNAPVFVNRIAWAKAHLKHAGLLTSPSRGKVSITPAGMQLLAEAPERIDIRFLKNLDRYTWHRRDDTQADQYISVAESVENRVTPEETLETAYSALRDALAADILERVKGCSPRFFEDLVVELLVSMGYGGSLADAGHAVGRSGDGGIDGIIKEDKLGLDVVCIQAKRWEGTVGRPVIQNFAGSMEGMRARKGVLMTTSTFSKRCAGLRSAD